MRRSNKKMIILIILVIIALIVGITYAVKKLSVVKSVNVIEIKESDIVYYKLRKDNKLGIINKDGEIVIQPQYTDIIIPNPTVDLFLCSNSNDLENAEWKAFNSKNEQVLTDYKEIEAIPINKLSSIVPYEKTVLKYKDGNFYGLIDYSGKKVLPAEYEEIKNIDYKEGYLKVKKNGLYGITTIDGKKVLNTDYNDVMADGYYDTKNKYAKAGFILQIKADDGYKYGYADVTGKEIIDCRYSDLSRINEIEDENNVYMMSKLNGKTGLINNDKQIIENEFDSIVYDRNNSILVVEKGTLYGIKSLDGKEILPVQFDSINIGGEYINAVKSGNREVYNTDGNKIETEYSSYEKVSKNNSIVIDSENNYMIVDSTNRPILNEKYVYIESIKNDLYIATKDNYTGIINSNGNVVVPFKYSTIQKIDNTEVLEGLIVDNNQIDIINASGKIIDGFENAKIEKNDKYIRLLGKNGVKYFDINGNLKEFKDIESDNKIFASCNNGKWGFVDSKGNVVVDYIYDMVTEQNGKVAGVKKDGLWGVIDPTGKMILNPTYKIEWDNVKFLSTYYEINNVGETVYSGDNLQ